MSQIICSAPKWTSQRLPRADAPTSQELLLSELGASSAEEETRSEMEGEMEKGPQMLDDPFESKLMGVNTCEHGFGWLDCVLLIVNYIIEWIYFKGIPPVVYHHNLPN